MRVLHKPSLMRWESQDFWIPALYFELGLRNPDLSRRSPPLTLLLQTAQFRLSSAAFRAVSNAFSSDTAMSDFTPVPSQLVLVVGLTASPIGMSTVKSAASS